MEDLERKKTILRRYGVLGTNADELLQALEDTKVEARELTQERMVLIDLTHLTLCKDDHNTTCKYHHEEEFDRTWERPSHAAWKDKTVGLLETHRLSEEELRAVLKELLALTDKAFTIAVEFGVFKK